MTESTAAPRTPTVVDRVTAVMVCHNGATWLPRALAALDAQERQPDRVVLVDTGSSDATTSLLAERPDVQIVRLDQRTGFGAAVSAGLDSVSGQHELHERDPDFAVVDWVWLLHDDCAPERDALEILVAATEQRDSIAVVGPKIRGWTDPRELREVGVTIARSGRRETGLEYNEQDQGQHDGQRDVMAVGSSGMLVRRAVWDDLGGFDPYLSFFRDDIDFCWRVRAAGHRVVVVTDAVVFHAEAASRGRRDVPSRWSRPHRIDRANAMLVLLTNLRALSLLLAVPRLVVGSLVRSVGFLLGKAPGVALDELWALAIVLRHPGRIRSARRDRRATRTEQPRETQRMLAPRTAQLHHAVEAVAGVLSSRREPPSHVLLGADEDGLGEAPLASHRSLRERIATHPGVVMVAVLSVVSIFACRHLLAGGQLLGGALLPAPAGASDLWAALRGVVALGWRGQQHAGTAVVGDRCRGGDALPRSSWVAARYLRGRAGAARSVVGLCDAQRAGASPRRCAFGRPPRMRCFPPRLARSPRAASAPWWSSFCCPRSSGCSRGYGPPVVAKCRFATHGGPGCSWRLSPRSCPSSGVWPWRWGSLVSCSSRCLLDGRCLLAPRGRVLHLWWHLFCCSRGAGISSGIRRCCC